MDKKNIFGCAVAATALVVIWEQTHLIQNRLTIERAEVGMVKTAPVRSVQRLSSQKQFPSHAVPQSPPTVEALSAAIWQELNSDNEGGRETVLTKLLPELIALDPIAAAKLVGATTNLQGREELLRQLLQTWTTSDATAALAWAGRLTDPNEQQSSLIYATKQMAELDPAAAAVAVGSLTAEGQAAVTGDIALTWANKDLTGALKWAASQPAGEQRDAIMARVAFVESRTAPEAAANLVIKEIPPGLAQEEAVMSILHQWALQDFQAAKAWADRFPASQLLDRAMAELSGIASRATNHAN